MISYLQTSKKEHLFLMFIILLLVSFGQSNAQDTDWFKDVTVQVGLENAKDSYMQSVDLNGDNYPELLLGTGKWSPNVSNTFTLYKNVPDPENPGSRKFVDYTEESGINVNRDPNKSYREFDIAVFGDVDNDGDYDLVTSFYYHRLENFQKGHNDRPEVYLNDGTGHFTLKENSGLNNAQYFHNLDPGMIDGVAISFIDFDYDGNLDIYLGTKFVDYKYSVMFPDVLMKGNGDGTFFKVETSGVDKYPEPLYGVNVTDWNNDGWQDVITSPYCRTGGKLHRNNKDGTFSNVAKSIGYSSQHLGGDNGQALCQWEAPAADFDNDGDMDFLQLLVHGGMNSNEGHTVIAVNQGAPDYLLEWELGRIQRDESSNTHLGDYAGLWSDWDNDGLLDIVICEGYYTPATRRVYMCKQDETNHFFDVSAELGMADMPDASGVESLDFDLDGDNDLIIFHNGTIKFWRNDIGNKSNWISVKLDAPEACNQAAFGARITVCSDGVNQIREIQAGLGHFGGQQPFIRNIGIGDHNRVDSIIVRWPMQGIPETVVYNPPINMIIEINENGMIDELVEYGEENRALIAFNTAYTKFDSTDVGAVEEKDFIIKNIGNLDLIINEFGFMENESNLFWLIDSETSTTVTDDNFEALTIAPNASKAYKIMFAPLVRSLNKEQLFISSNASNVSDGEMRYYDIVGIGFGPAPMIKVFPTELVFENVNPSETKSITVTNWGEYDFEITGIDFEEDPYGVFSHESESSTYTVAAGESVEIDVTFTPVFRTGFFGDMIIKSTAYNEQETKITLAGTGDVPTAEIRVSRSIFSFSSVELGESKIKDAYIRNNGDKMLSLTELRYDDDEGVFTFPDITFPFEVAVDTERDFTAVFTPKDDHSSYSTNITFVSNSLKDSLRTIKFTGKGKPSTSVSDFGMGEERLTLSVSPNPIVNSGTINMTLGGNSVQSIEIYTIDASGRKIEGLSNMSYVPGDYKLNINNAKYANGMYFIVARAGKHNVRIPMVISK
ncbi:MAG: VCBS repeat-containing protein [Chlorobi bacterium]|nr:VCBS repeat-containing protein [Chlorobiota bacterium]